MNSQLSTRFILLAVLFTLFQKVTAQTNNKPNKLDGEVSFATSENIYLRFKTTEPLVSGDTVYLVNGSQLKPCLIIQQKSSVSVIATTLEGCSVKKGDKVAYFYADKKQQEPEVAPVPATVQTDSTITRKDKKKKLTERKLDKIA